MKNLKCSWNFKDAEKNWKEQVLKVFPTLDIKSLRQDFTYPLNGRWPDKTHFTNLENNSSQLLVYSNNLSKKQVIAYNAVDVLNNKKLSSYQGRGDLYHSLGFDGKWEVALILNDLISYWQKKKLPSIVKVTCSVSENLFFEQVKLQSAKLLIEKLFLILKCNSKLELTALTSERMLASADYKNNVVRLSYAVFSALLSNVSYIAVRPLPGFNPQVSWKLSCQTYNVISLETHINQMANPHLGAVFFESAVEDFSKKTWNALQALLSLKNKQEISIFKNNILKNAQQSSELNLQTARRKVVGVNDYIAPNAPKAKINFDSEFIFLEKKRLNYAKLSKKYLDPMGFYYLGNKSQIIKTLNLAYQFFSMLDIAVTWKEWDLNSAKKYKTLIIIFENETSKDILKEIIDNKKIKVVFSNAGIDSVKVKVLDFKKSHFDLWDDFWDKY